MPATPLQSPAHLDVSDPEEIEEFVNVVPHPTGSEENKDVAELEGTEPASELLTSGLLNWTDDEVQSPWKIWRNWRTSPACRGDGRTEPFLSRPRIAKERGGRGSKPLLPTLFPSMR